jgi:hypothetical protein
LRQQTVTPKSQRTLGVCHSKELDVLEVVEIRQAIERESSAAVTAHEAFPESEAEYAKRRVL